LGFFYSYYILQIIEHDKKNTYHLFRRWGRIGNSKIGGIKSDKMSKPDAIKEFKRLFREKTGNEWEAWENKTDFRKQPNKFYPLEIVSFKLNMLVIV
jgi:poly [ADP-ribose] polymerase